MIHILAIITAITDEEERSFIEDIYIKQGKTMWKYAMYLTKNTMEAKIPELKEKKEQEYNNSQALEP